MQEVPAESRPLRAGEQYGVWEGEGAPPPVGAHVAAVCPVCRSRVVVGAEQVGRSVACHDCGTPVVMPAPDPVAAPPKAQPGRPQADPADEGYPVLEEVEDVPPGQGRAGATRTYIPVHCPLCRTLMQATEDQVGGKLVCPDCGTPTGVAAPKRAARPGAPAPVHESYAVIEEAGPVPADSRVVYGAYVKVRCPVCQALLHFTEDQAGRRVACPDCDTPLEVPRRAPPKKKTPKKRTGVGRGRGDTYQVGWGSEAPGYRRVVAASSERWAFVEARRRKHATGPPPRWPLLSGVFGYPASPAARSRWFWLSLWLAVAAGLVVRGLTMVGAPGGGLGNLPAWVAALLSNILGFAVLLPLLPVASAFAVAVIEGAASGDDTLEEFTEVPFLDWVLDGLFVINSLALSCGLVYCAAWLARGAEEAVPWIWGGGLLLLLPIVLLSMLETGSSLRPFSAPVWRSLFVNGPAWIGFLAESALLWGAVAGAIWGVGLLPGIPAVLAVLVGTSLGVYAMIVYCRMLGRLAWCCAAGERGSEPVKER